MAYDTKNIRNVVLLGHPGSGKTTLAETMLFESGAISRRGTVEDGSTVSDHTNIEQGRQNSIFSSLMHAKWRDCKINIIDTPGFDDFIGEVIAALKVADTAMMVLNAKGGVEVGTELMWEYVEKFKTPAMFVVNQLDNEKADFESTLEQAKDRFGNKVIPVQFPVNAGAGFNAIVDCLRMTMYVFPEGGGKPEKKEIPEEHKGQAEEIHGQLVEAAAENDDTLMEKFFEEGTLSESEIAQGLTMSLATQGFYPMFCCSSTKNMGTGRIMGFINDIAPSPAERPEAELEGGGTLKCDTNGKPAIFIYKTMSEPRIGQLSYFKLFSGKLSGAGEFHNSRNRTSERISQLYEANGKNRENVNELCAGDIGVTVKLKDAVTNDTLTDKGSSTRIAPIVFPEPRIRTAVNPPSKAEMEKLVKALNQIAAEDPTLIVEQSQTLKQTLIHGQGQLHLDITAYRIEKVNNVKMDFVRPKVSYRETITKAASGSYRHKKQSGGSGQFGEVHMRIEPYYEGMPAPDGLNVRNTEEDELPWGGKLIFMWCIVGGSIDAKYSNAIKKGVMQKMEEGPLTGSYCQDLRVCIYDGKMHPVDSNDMAFMLAASTVFKNNFNEAAPQLLEPIYDVEILCSGDVMGDVMGDLQTRRAMIMGMDAEGHYQKIKAKVPIAEMYKYSSTLRSITQGRAKFTRKLSEYMAVTPDIQKDLIRAYQSELQEA